MFPESPNRSRFIAFSSVFRIHTVVDRIRTFPSFEIFLRIFEPSFGNTLQRFTDRLNSLVTRCKNCNSPVTLSKFQPCELTYNRYIVDWRKLLSFVLWLYRRCRWSSRSVLKPKPSCTTHCVEFLSSRYVLSNIPSLFVSRCYRIRASHTLPIIIVHRYQRNKPFGCEAVTRTMFTSFEFTLK